MEAVLQPQLWIAMVATLLAGIARGFTGFGAAMTLAPVFAILYSAPQAVATTAALGMLASLQLLPGAIRDTDWREVVPLTLAAWVTIPLGALLLLSLEPDLMRRGISGLVLVLVLLLLSGWPYPVRPGLWGATGTGALAGLLNGATGVGGPPVVLYLLGGNKSARSNRANLITYFTTLNGGTCVSLYFHGVYTLETVWRTLSLWPVQILSLWAGAWLFRHASDRIYRHIALGMLLAIALLGLFYRRG